MSCGDMMPQGCMVQYITNVHVRVAQVYVSTPSSQERMQMVLFFLRGIDHTLCDQSRAHIASYTEGWSGSEIEVTNYTMGVGYRFMSRQWVW